MIALIPARAGSKRIPGKNFKKLAGWPLIDYTIAATVDSGVFDRIWLCTDADHVGEYAALWPFVIHLLSRPPVPDDQPDIEWVREALETDKEATLKRAPSFAILRPTSPFRTAETIKRAYKEFHTPDATLDSLRAVEPVSQHPGKMWSWEGPGYPIRPLLDRTTNGTPWHSSPTQSLPTYYVQNASLEMSYTSNVEVHGTISGRKVAPFFTRDYEGFDINTPDDWTRAEALIAAGAVQLPPVDVARLSAATSAQ